MWKIDLENQNIKNAMKRKHKNVNKLIKTFFLIKSKPLTYYLYFFHQLKKKSIAFF